MNRETESGGMIMIRIQKCTVREFGELIKEKQVICFGGGQRLLDICETYTMGGQLFYIVDKYKSGTRIEIGERKVPVLSMEQIGEEIKKSVPVLTSIKYADEIIDELDRIALCDQISFYMPEMFQNDPEEPIQNLMRIQRIPKIIHFCWFGRGEIPPEFKKNIETWKEKCPDYEVCCWSEDNYDVSKNTYMKQAYEKGKWGFVPDYARLDIIYHYGGIYLDTDVEVCRSFDELLQFDMFCGFETMFQIALGLGFGAVKGNFLLKDMMQVYEKEKFIHEDGTLNLIPSPVYQTKTLSELGLKKNGCTQKLGNSIILSPEYLSPVNEFGFGKPTENTYSIHHYAATWYGEEQCREKERIKQNYQKVLMRMNHVR